MFDFSKLKGKIVEVFGTQDRFAEAIGITPVGLSKKMNNKTRFTSDDIMLICDKLGILTEEIGTYFFTLKV